MRGRPEVRTVALVALSAVVSHSLARSTYPILLPAIEAELLSSHQEAGALSTVNFGAYLGGVFVVTAISGRVEPARLLKCGLGTSAVGFVALSTADGFWTMAIGLGLTGAASAGIWMSAPVLATAAVDPSRRGMVMGLLSSTMGLGIVTASQGTRLVRAIQDDDGAWRPIWLAAVLYTVVLLGVTFALLRTPPTDRVKGGISLARLRSVPGSLPMTVAYWLSGLVIAGFTPFFGAALEEGGFSRDHVANLYSLFGLSAACGAVVFGRVSDRVGRRPVLAGAMVATAVSSLLVLAAAEPFATIAALMFGAASFTFPVLIAAYLGDHLQGRAFSNALGALTLIYGTALVIGPIASGTVGDTAAGFDAVFATFAGAAVVAAVLIFRLPAIRSPAPSSESSCLLEPSPSEPVPGGHGRG